MKRFLAAAALCSWLLRARWRRLKTHSDRVRPPAGGRAGQRQSPGGTLTIALEQVIRAGWHTYWINPGDVGQATSIDWALPAGWKAGELQWATPKRLPVGPFMDYGYEGKVWLLTNVDVPADAKVGATVPLKATAHFLVCQQVCVPEDADADAAR